MHKLLFVAVFFLGGCIQIEDRRLTREEVTVSFKNMLDLIQKDQARIKDLETRITALENVQKQTK